MTGFRLLLGVIFCTITAYTVIVISNHGWNLFPIFFGDIATMTWRGQFNVDFTSFLSLSALWVAWRHHFTPWGLLLAVLAFFGGGLFLSLYLLLASLNNPGDISSLLLGNTRARSTNPPQP